MADLKPTKKTKTETFRVYGQDIAVTYDYTEDPEQRETLELEKISDKIKLNPSQEVLSKQLFLPEFIQEKYKTDPKGADKWLNGILHEIIIDKCRTDSDIIAAKPCINFQAYLMQLAAQIQRNPTKIPYVKQNRMGSMIEIKRQIAVKKAQKSAEEDYGDLSITLTIQLKDILNPEGPGSESDGESGSESDGESGSQSDNTTEYSTDESDDTVESDTSIIKKEKHNRKLKKKKIKKTFRPSNCKKETKYAAITDTEITSQIGGDPMEALYRIFKQYRGKTCEAENLLTESLPYDEYTKMMLNQGNYQFNQFRRLYELYKIIP
jgi:hypothetical protein